MIIYQLENERGIDLAQADIDAGIRCQDPWKAPAVAMEHRQRPKIDRMRGHIPGDDL